MAMQKSRACTSVRSGPTLKSMGKWRRRDRIWFIFGEPTQFSPASSSKMLELKGKRPVSSLYAMTPTAKMSEAGEYFPAYASCAMYWSVPTTLSGSRWPPGAHASTVSKSISFTTGEWLPSLSLWLELSVDMECHELQVVMEARSIMTFSSFRSLWMQPTACSSATAASSCRRISLQSERGRRPWQSRVSKRSWPVAFSITT
mmetsp:Transcript_12450/g.28525  ORF Transcript_12450/g.28525 Transcript_12450/m.28525 type:complete len:202 (-) Transcript_12450:188-793(-)